MSASGPSGPLVLACPQGNGLRIADQDAASNLRSATILASYT